MTQQQKRQLRTTQPSQLMETLGMRRQAQTEGEDALTSSAGCSEESSDAERLETWHEWIQRTTGWSTFMVFYSANANADIPGVSGPSGFWPVCGREH